MEVGQGPSWGCSFKGEKKKRWKSLHGEEDIRLITTFAMFNVSYVHFFWSVI
jgi:hypothetical protein